MNFARNGAALFLAAVTTSMVVNVVVPVDGAEPRTAPAVLVGGLAAHLEQPLKADQPIGSATKGGAPNPQVQRKATAEATRVARTTQADPTDSQQPTSAPASADPSVIATANPSTSRIEIVTLAPSPSASRPAPTKATARPTTARPSATTKAPVKPSPTKKPTTRPSTPATHAPSANPSTRPPVTIHTQPTTKPTRPVETHKPVETTKPADPTTRPVETSKPVETTKPADPTTKPVETTKPADPKPSCHDNRDGCKTGKDKGNKGNGKNDR